MIVLFSFLSFFHSACRLEDLIKLLVACPYVSDCECSFEEEVNLTFLKKTLWVNSLLSPSSFFLSFHVVFLFFFLSYLFFPISFPSFICNRQTEGSVRAVH